MRDPHVVSLRYRLETDPSLSFDNPPPIEQETDEFTLRLADGMLTCEMKAHYASVDAARAVIDQILLAWELDFALQQGRRLMRFVYQDVDVIDRNPLPPGTPRGSDTIGPKLIEHACVVRTQAYYPAPPVRFKISPDVETLWHRYEGYMQGREPLLSMVNACLTWLTAQVRGQENAARIYAIALAVLRKLSDFAANLGDERTARKFHARSARRAPTAQEAAWIDAAIRMIIHRIGEHAADPMVPWPMLSMSDLPPL